MDRPLCCLELSHAPPVGSAGVGRKASSRARPPHPQQLFDLHAQELRRLRNSQRGLRRRPFCVVQRSAVAGFLRRHSRRAKRGGSEPGSGRSRRPTPKSAQEASHECSRLQPIFFNCRHDASQRHRVRHRRKRRSTLPSCLWIPWEMAAF